jgi:hypothetical protein
MPDHGLFVLGYDWGSTPAGCMSVKNGIIRGLGVRASAKIASPFPDLTNQ